MSDVNITIADSQPIDVTLADSTTPIEVTIGEGIPGAPGVGVPTGGTAGQVLTKDSPTDFDTSWQDPSGAVDSVNGQSGAVVLTATDVGADIAGAATSAEINAKNYTDTQVSAINVPDDISDLTDTTGIIPTTTSDLTNDSNFATTNQLFSGNYSDLTNKPNIPTNNNQLTNGAGYITGYTETDPTVPAWAKSPTKPSYTKADIGLGNVDNTSDLNKPVSTATQTTLNTKTDGIASSVDSRLAVFDGTTGKALKQADYYDLPDTAMPPTPPADTLRFFAKRRAGKMLPMIIGPEGIDSMLQPALFGATVSMWLPSYTTAVSIAFGNQWVARNSGTGAVQSHPSLATTNDMTSMVRARFSTGTTATGASGITGGQYLYWRGNSAGRGGFFSFFRFGEENLASDSQAYIGFSSSNAALGGEPSARPNLIGLCKDSTDTNWQIVSRGASGSATKYDTGIVITNNQVLDMFIHCEANSSMMTVRILDAVTRAVLVDGYDVTATLPSNTAFLCPQALVRSTTSVTSQHLALNRIYVQTDI